MLKEIKNEYQQTKKSDPQGQTFLINAVNIIRCDLIYKIIEPI